MRKYIIILMSVVYSMNCFGQEMPKIIPPSPEAANAFKFTEIPVSLYTGLPNIDIPLFEIESGGVTVPISISYHARGIQVAEIASRVGLGWTLNAGGMISKQVRDEDDELGYGGCANYDSFFTNYQVRQNVIPYQNNNTMNICDMIPDQYSFSVNGLSGKMIYGRGNDRWFTQNYSDLIVSPGQIIDTKGNKYLFGERSAFDSDISMDNFIVVPGSTNNSGTDGDNYLANTKHLTTILTAQGGKIEFFYSKETIYYYQRTHDKLYGSAPFNESYVTLKHSEQQRLNSIVFENGRVLFEYDLNDREDLPGSRRLKKIKLEDANGNIIKQVVFEYDYTFSDDVQNVNSFFATSPDNLAARKRMFLKTVQIVDYVGAVLPPYRFEYDDTVLPSRHSNSVDVWGYYNGKNNGTFLETLLDNRSVDPVKVQAGMLKKIIKPEGGSINFYYEPNKAVNVFPEDKVWIGNANPTIPRQAGLGNLMATATEGNIDLDANPNTPFYKENGLYEDVFTISEFQTGVITYSSTGSGFEGCGCGSITVGCTQNTQVPCRYSRALLKWNSTSQSFEATNFLLYSGTRNIILEPGKYKLQVNYIGSQLPYQANHQDNFFMISFSWFEEETTQVPPELIGEEFACSSDENYTGNKVVFAAGNRINKIEYKNPGDTVALTKTYSYVYPQTQHTSGRVLGLTNYLTFNQVSFNGQTATAYEPFGTGAGSLYSTYQSNAVGYKYVTEYLGDGTNTIGKTEYTYTMIYDTGRYYEFPYHPPTDNEWLRGKELSVVHYKKVGNSYEIVQKKENTYLLANEVEYSPLGAPCNNPFLKPSVIKFIAQNTDADGLYLKNRFKYRIPLAVLPINMVGSPDYGYKTYYQTGGTMDLKKTKVIDYLNGGEIVTETTHNYNYNSHYNPSSVLFTASDGAVTKTEYQYVSELTTVPHAQDLINKNMTSIPLVTKTYRGATKLSETKTEYDCWSNCTNIDPFKRLLFPLKVETSKGDATLEERIRYKYDGKGNLIEASQTNGTKISYIYGYNQTLAVAKIENIAYDTIPPTLISAIQSATDSPNSTEQDVLNALSDLYNSSDANLQKAMITTLTYIPLVGVSTITDPKGQLTRYEYDNFNRLMRVSDSEGNPLTETEYHYRNQN